LIAILRTRSGGDVKQLLQVDVLSQFYKSENKLRVLMNIIELTENTGLDTDGRR